MRDNNSFFNGFFRNFGLVAIVSLIVNIAMLAGAVYVVCLVLRHFGVIG